MECGFTIPSSRVKVEADKVDRDRREEQRHMEIRAFGGPNAGIGAEEKARMSLADRELRLLLREAGMDGLDVGRLVREFGGDAARPVEEYETCVRMGCARGVGETAATRAGPREANGEGHLRVVS